MKKKHSLEDGRLVRGRDARSRLIASAIKVFGTYGFEGTSLRTIADQAGLAFQLTTYHFGSKEELWIAALTHLFDLRLERAKKQKFDPDGDLDQQLRDWIRGRLLNAVEEPMLRRIFTQEYFENSTRYQRILKPKIEELMEVLNALHSQLTELKVITRFSPQEVQWIFSSVLGANSILPYEIQLAIGHPPGHKKAVDFQVELLFNLFTKGHGAPS